MTPSIYFTAFLAPVLAGLTIAASAMRTASREADTAATIQAVDFITGKSAKFTFGVSQNVSPEIREKAFAKINRNLAAGKSRLHFSAR